MVGAVLSILAGVDRGGELRGRSRDLDFGACFPFETGSDATLRSVLAIKELRVSLGLGGREGVLPLVCCRAIQHRQQSSARLRSNCRIRQAWPTNWDHGCSRRKGIVDGLPS